MGAILVLTLLLGLKVSACCVSALLVSLHWPTGAGDMGQFGVSLSGDSHSL